MTTKQQAKNAIKWIENLSDYNQAPLGKRGMLGDKERGYCCLGAGCKILKVKYNPSVGSAPREFTKRVGLKTPLGHFLIDEHYYGQTNLAAVNDSTSAGFSRIANFMKIKPEWMFAPEVACRIKKHYSKQ